MIITLLALSILPVILLMIYIDRKDKYQKEPFKCLLKAFLAGMIAIPIDLILVNLLNMVWYSNTVFYSAFLEAGIPEETSKLLVFLIFIWRDKHFDEYMDGIVYATFIGLGFACIENIMYVFGAAEQSWAAGISTSIVRGLLSVPGHFLFGVVLGYFLSLAKFSKTKKQRWAFILSGLLLAATCHGFFDWLLMASDALGEVYGTILSVVFLIGDFFLWKLGIKYIRRQQINSRNQAISSLFHQSDPIDWNAGFK